MSDCRSRGRKFESQLCHTTSVESDHYIISTVILHIQLFQEGQLSFTGRGLILPRKSMGRLIDWLHMILTVFTGPLNSNN